MDEPLLRQIAQDHLVPFFSGSELEPQPIKSRSDSELVAFQGPNGIAFKVLADGKYRLVLRRAQRFAAESHNVVPEIAVVRAFVSTIQPMTAALATELRPDLLSTISRRIVAKATASIAGREQVLLSGIDQLSRWANRTYEGQAISAAFGFRHKNQDAQSPVFKDIVAQDFGAVLSNGHDTILEFDFGGRFIRHASLKKEAAHAFAPQRLSRIAHWSIGDEHRRRVALCLNRSGEILIIRDGALLFARRSGIWHFLTHQPIIQQMNIPHETAIRGAIYETCLDASFARTGACIGAVSHKHANLWKKIVVNAEDRVRDESSTKAKVLLSSIGSKKFHQLDRRLRQEITAIDGATVISHTGEVLAAGAILKIEGGSASGGRLAAAKALSNLGLGVKVSQDGGIKGFLNGAESPAFQLM